jgi:hypothetical protein
MLDRTGLREILEKVRDTRQALGLAANAPVEGKEGSGENATQTGVALRCADADLSKIEEMVEKALQYIVPTTSFDQIRSGCMAHVTKEAITGFFLYPIEEVREYIVGQMKFDSAEACDFAEEFINFVLSQQGQYMNSCYDSNLLEILLRSYLFRSQAGSKIDPNLDFQARAAEFTSNLALKQKHPHGSILYDNVSKNIKNLIKNKPKIYSMAPSIKALCESSINEMLSESSYYGDNAWKLAERAFLVVSAVEDFSFIDVMKKLLKRLESGDLKYLDATPRGNRSMLEFVEKSNEGAAHIASLKSMIKMLKEEAEKQKLRDYQKDIN